MHNYYHRYNFYNTPLLCTLYHQTLSAIYRVSIHFWMSMTNSESTNLKDIIFPTEQRNVWFLSRQLPSLSSSSPAWKCGNCCKKYYNRVTLLAITSQVEAGFVCLVYFLATQCDFFIDRSVVSVSVCTLLLFIIKNEKWAQVAVYQFFYIVILNCTWGRRTQNTMGNSMLNVSMIKRICHVMSDFRLG